MDRVRAVLGVRGVVPASGEGRAGVRDVRGRGVFHRHHGDDGGVRRYFSADGRGEDFYAVFHHRRHRARDGGDFEDHRPDRRRQGAVGGEGAGDVGSIDGE